LSKETLILDNDELKILVGSYRRIFSSEEGDTVLKDIRNFCSVDEQVGSQLTHAECAYRNGMQDLFRYIEAMASEDR